MDIVIFGIGETYKNRKKFFQDNRDRINIVAFLDNNPKVQGKKLDGAAIYAPREIKNLCFDGIVILSIKYQQEMTAELLDIGIKEDLIWNFCTLKLTALRGKRTLYGSSKAYNVPIDVDINFDPNPILWTLENTPIPIRGHLTVLLLK